MVKVEPKPEDEKIVAWAGTKTGGRFPIKEGEDKEAALARHIDHLQKTFVKRFNLPKTVMKIREEVVYDAFTKMGIVAGFAGDSVRILGDRGVISMDKNFVFKKSELIGGRHWDGISLSARLELLKNAHISQDFVNSSWYFLDYNIRNVIQKAEGPAGYEGGGLNTSTSGVFNPVHDDQTVSERIKDESKKPSGQSVASEQKEPSGGAKKVSTDENISPENDYNRASQDRQPNTEKARENSMVD